MERGDFPEEVAMPEKTRVEITETSEPPAKARFQAALIDFLTALSDPTEQSLEALTAGAIW